MKYVIDLEGYVIIDADSKDDAEHKFLDLLYANNINRFEFGDFNVEEDE